MTAKSKDVGRDIARLALADALYETDTLTDVLTYCWDQLGWYMSDSNLIALRDTLKVSSEDT